MYLGVLVCTHMYLYVCVQQVFEPHGLLNFLLGPGSDYHDSNKYIFLNVVFLHMWLREHQKKFGFVLVELLLRSSSMRWALGDNNIIHCWDQWWEKCRVSWKKLQQKKRKSQRGDEEDKNSKGQTKSTHPQRVRTEDTEGRSSQALDQPPGRHRFSENLRSNGDVGRRHRTDLLHLQGLLQSQLLIGCLLLFLFVL